MGIDETCTIYKISHCFNDKVYIGQTRESNLLSYFNNSHVHGRNRIKLYNAIKKYGRDNFKIEPICSCLTQEAADEMEIFFIKEYNSIKNGYNIRSGGNGGGKLSPESIKKISKNRKGIPPWNKGIPMSDVTKVRLSNSLKGRKTWSKGNKFSKEYRKKLSDAQKGNRNKLGKPCSEETKRKLSEINRKFSDEEEHNIIIKYDELKSSIKVAKIFDCNPLTIRNIIKRVRGSL